LAASQNRICVVEPAHGHANNQALKFLEWHPFIENCGVCGAFVGSVMLHDPIPTHEALLDAGMVSHKIPPAFSIPCHPIYMNVFASSKLRSSRIQTSREGTTILLCTAMGNLFVQGRRRSGRELQNPCPSMMRSPAWSPAGGGEASPE
jgi:hypothetical protein